MLINPGKAKRKSVVPRCVSSVTGTEMNVILKGVKEGLKGIE